VVGIRDLHQHLSETDEDKEAVIGFEQAALAALPDHQLVNGPIDVAFWNSLDALSAKVYSQTLHAFAAQSVWVAPNTWCLSQKEVGNCSLILTGSYAQSLIYGRFTDFWIPDDLRLYSSPKMLHFCPRSLRRLHQAPGFRVFERLSLHLKG